MKTAPDREYRACEDERAQPSRRLLLEHAIYQAASPHSETEREGVSEFHDVPGAGVLEQVEHDGAAARKDPEQEPFPRKPREPEDSQQGKHAE